MKSSGNRNLALTGSTLATIIPHIFIPRPRLEPGKKAIQSLKLDDTEWCSDHERLRAAATSYFASMFDVGDVALTSFPFVGFPPNR
ncbi:hypothetical protein V6N13_001330 [Hibiscus sabdariffa]